MVFQAVRPILGDLFEGVPEFLVGKCIAFVKQLAEINKYLLDGLDVTLVAVDEQFIAAGTDADIEKCLEILDVLILNAEQRIESLWW